MTLQYWFTENVTPKLTEEQRETYRGLVVNQQLPIGNEVSGRRMYRCLTDEDNITVIMEMLTELGKEPRMIAARDAVGTDYIKRNIAEYQLHMQPVESVGVNSEVIMMQPADNTSAGWAAFMDVVDKSVDEVAILCL